MKNWFFITFVLFATSASAQIEWIDNFSDHGFHFNWNMVDSIAVIDSGRVYAPRRNNVYQVVEIEFYNPQTRATRLQCSKVMSRAEAREVVLNLRQEIKNRENANLRLQNRLLKDAEALGNFEKYIQADTTGG